MLDSMSLVPDGRRIMQPTQAVRLLVSGLIALALGCADDRPTSSSSRGDGLAEGALSAPSMLAHRQNIGRGVTIVLVHGAFVDASGWQDVIPILQSDGFNVIAVQNPLSSLANDVAWTRRVIKAQSGPVVVVGHSYGGAVITGAAAGNSNVRALVYIAAYAPDVGEPIGALNALFPPTALGTALIIDAAGFLYVDVAKFRPLFAADVPERRTAVLAVTQKPLFAAAFGETLDQAAWRTIPSWYLVAREDQAINPDLERFMAQRMGARTTEIRSSHVPFASRPEKVAELIEEAAMTGAGSTP
jgi:pimeloyl-ACP methyl ester carboxylesterase